MRSEVWFFAGLCVLCVAGVIVGGCAFNDEGLQGCMRARMHNLIAFALNLASAFVAGTSGMGVARSTGRLWVGWVVGLALFVAGALFLGFVGFSMPETDE
jgi:hypothetical protein